MGFVVDKVTLDFFPVLRFPFPVRIHFSPLSSGASTVGHFAVLVPRGVRCVARLPAEEKITENFMFLTMPAGPVADSAPTQFMGLRLSRV
jgi:hypothetical protein